MGKVRKKSRNTFNYSVNRKKLKRRAQKKAAPRITCDEIRNAWNDSKSVAGNMADMGLAADPNKALPIHTNTVKNRSAEQKQVRKPYVIEKEVKQKKKFRADIMKYIESNQSPIIRINDKATSLLSELKALASLPSKKTMGISSDMVLYVRHMVENYGEDYKAMARDDENYYQDTPKQIQRKINLYKRHHPDEYQALITSTTKQ